MNECLVRAPRTSDVFNNNILRANNQVSLKRAETTAILVAFIMYPFTHLYAYYSAVGVVPRFMDGVFSLIAIITILILGYYFLKLDSQKMHHSTALYIFAFFMFIFIGIAWVVSHRFFGYGPVASSELTIYYSRIFLYYVMLFLVGFYLRFDRWGKVFVIFFVIIFISSLYNIRLDRLMIELRHVVEPAYRGVYLTLSTTALFTGLIAWSVIKKSSLRVVILLVTFVTLFITGSRADFISYLIVLPLALWMTMRTTLRFALLIFSIATIGLFSLIINLDYLLVSRQLQIFGGIEQFTSLLARSRLLSVGFDQIISSPILGAYGDTLAELGSIGSYMHNIFSVWQAFGLLPFLIYVFFVITALYFSITQIINKGRTMDQHLQLIVLVCMIITVQVLFAKSMGWFHVALSWGMVAGWWQRENRNR